MDAGDLGNEGVAGVVGDAVGAPGTAVCVLHLVRSPGLNGFDGVAVARSSPGEAKGSVRLHAHHRETSAIGTAFEQDGRLAQDVGYAPVEAV